MENDSMSTVVRAAQGGDSQAFDSLVRQTEQSVRGVIRRRIRDDAEADDVSQEVFLRAYRCLHQLQDQTRFQAWVCQIAARLSINRILRQRRLQAIESVFGDLEDCLAGAPEAGMVQQERREQIQGGMSRLSRLDQQTLQAFYFEGRSVAEMSRLFAAPAGTVKRRLCHARRNLREILIRNGSGLC